MLVDVVAHPKSQPVVLVTGASSGVGLAIAQALLERPVRLVLTARASSLGRLEAAGIHASDRLWLRPLEVTDAAQRRAVVEEIDERLGGVDVLINNAGIMIRSVLEHMADADRVAQMAVNFNAPMELARLVLPAMRAKRAGRIITISSVGGMMAMPTMGAYSASKFALEGACEALWYEVRPWGIHVTLLEPGFIHSDAYRRVQYTPESEHGAEDELDPYHAHYEHMSPFIERVIRWTWATPEHVAKKVVKVMRRRSPPLRLAATPDARLFSILRRILPGPIYHRLLYALLPKIRSWGPHQD